MIVNCLLIDRFLSIHRNYSILNVNEVIERVSFPSTYFFQIDCRSKLNGLFSMYLFGSMDHNEKKNELP